MEPLAASSRPPPPPSGPSSPPDASGDKFDQIYARYMGGDHRVGPHADAKPVGMKKLDPPEERPVWEKATPQKVAISQHFTPPAVPAVASRDDEASQYSHRSYRSQHSASYYASTRDDVYSKLDSLNAKSRALRGMTYSPPSPALSSSASVLSSNSYSPTSVMSPYSTRAPDESIDSRLEYLTRQSMAMRRMGPGSPESAGPKKVTFEADYFQGSHVHGSGHSMDDRSVHSGRKAEDTKRTFVSQFNEKVPPVTSTASTTSASSFANSHSQPLASGRSLAMKVLSEKILDGYSMTRSHCPKCNVAMLRKDGSVSINGKAVEECVCCPVAKLRKNISRGVCKKVMAAKLLSGLEVGAANGKSLCDSCHSPHLKNAQGDALECQVCPILDMACVEIVREQGRGGVVHNARACLECSCPEVYNRGATKCVVCEVLVAQLGSGYSSSDAIWAGYSPSWAASKSVASGAGTQNSALGSALSVVSDGVSQPPGLTTSTSIKSGDQSINFAKIQELKEQLKMELAKAKASQQALETHAVGYPPSVASPSVASGFSRPMSAIIVKSPSITSGESPPVDLSKIEDQLKEVLAKADQSQHSEVGEGPDHLSQLQEQLLSELAQAKASQAKLEQSLAHSSQFANLKTREVLEAELEKAKQEQYALEQILQGTKNIETPAADNPSLSPTEDLLNAAANLRNQSYSISQQEVDATGHAKEYIPPPSYFNFQQSTVPTEVIVYHIPDDVDCDPSVAAQSHHTKNLKRSERDPAPHNPGIIDCCNGGAAANVHRHDAFDYDTIETDDDYTVDYTLNTIGDDSRLEYLREHRSKSLSMNDYQTEDGRTRQERNEARDVPPTSSIGRCLFACFGCGDDQEDAYTMVESSRRGLSLEQPVAPYPPQGILRRPTVRDRGMHAASYHSQSVDEESDYGSMVRVEQGVVPTQRKRLGRYSAEESEYGGIPRPPKSIGSSPDSSPNRDYSRKPSINESEFPTRDGSRGGGMSANRQQTRSPSPLFEFDSVVGGSMHRANAVHSPQGARPTLQFSSAQAFPRRSDFDSVTSDLSDPSSANRRVSAYDRPKMESQLRALTEEEEPSDVGGVGDKYSVRQ